MKEEPRRRLKWSEVPDTDAELVVIQCPSCGYHMGVDYSYLSQVGPIETKCPVPDCGNPCYVEDIE